MQIEEVVVGPLETNCYLVWDGEGGVIIDPGGDADLIISRIERAAWRPVFILLTHGHADHIAAVPQLKGKFSEVKVVIHKLDAPMLESDTSSFGLWMGIRHESIHVDRVVEDGDQISLSRNLNFKILHTPGHTPGSVCLLAGDLLFSGDTLFKNGIGRTDYPGGDIEEMQRSLKKLSELPPEMLVYPGHGSETKVGDELRGLKD